MFLDEKRNILNTQDNKKKLIKMENSEKKEINNINIPLINVKENFQPSNNLMSKKIIQKKKTEFCSLNNFDILKQNLKNLKNSMKEFDKNNFIDIKDFKRDLFINYSYNPKFENYYLIEKNNSPSKLLKNNSNIKSILGNKTNRKEENKVEINLNSKDNLKVNNPLVSFKDGILRIDTNEIYDSYQNNIESIQNNKYVKLFFYFFRILVWLNKITLFEFTINKHNCKVNKKYIFCNISNVLFIITKINDNYKITEIYKKKENEKFIISEKIIFKELFDIKNYLENRQNE